MSLMQAYKGFYDNGRFFPEEHIELTGYFQAILLVETSVIDDTNKKVKKEETALEKWNQIMQMIKAALDEPMPEFPRMEFGRDLIDL